MDVLLLEDDDALRYTYAEALELRGDCVREAASVEDAEHVLLATRPDIAVLDLLVGSENSIGIANLLAFMSPKTEIIFVTGSSMFPHAELHQMHPKVAAVLRKPVDLLQLTELVSHIEGRPRIPSADQRPESDPKCA